MGEELELVEDLVETVSTTAAPENVVEATKEAAVEVVNQTKTLLHLDQLKEYLTWGNMMKVVTSIIAILIFWLAYKIITKVVKKTAAKKLEVHTVNIITKTIKYVFYVLLVMYVLNLFGINLTAIWGAAGIAGVAIGFAAQTSVSNLISGVFVIAEKAMKIGDYIEVAGVSGTVDSVGLLSITIHTLDNQMIRIPNSTIINSNLINYSSFEKRRFVFPLPISYDSDMETAMVAAQEVADICVKNGVILNDPAPCIFYDGFGDAVNLRLAVWFEKSKLIDAKNAIYVTAAKVFKEYGVVIPFTRYDINILSEEEKQPQKPSARVAEKLSSKKTDELEVKQPLDTVAIEEKPAEPKRRGRKPKTI